MAIADLFKRRDNQIEVEHKLFVGPKNKYGYGPGGATRNKNIERVYQLARSQSDSGNFEGAFKVYQSAISLEPDNYAHYLAAGIAAFGTATKNNKIEMLNEAIELLERGLTLDPDLNAEREFRDYLEKSRKERTPEKLERGDKLSSMSTHYKLGIKHQLGEEYDKALNEFNKALNLMKEVDSSNPMIIVIQNFINETERKMAIPAVS